MYKILFIQYILTYLLSPVVARRHHRITTTKECYARSGTCYMRSDNEDCPSNTSITLGRCDTRGSGCCFNRDDFCEAKNGTCGLTTVTIVQ